MIKQLTKTIILIALAIFIQGCASNGPTIYPDYSTGARVHVSPKTVSTMTETPAADHLLADSQVFINGGGNPSVYSRLTGGLIGIPIDRSSSKSLVKSIVKDQDAVFAVKFDNLIKDLINEKSANKLDLKLSDTDQSDIKLLPSARISWQKDNSVNLALRLTSRFTDQQTGKQKTKEYHYGIPALYPLEGPTSLAGNGGQIFKDKTAYGFSRLVDILLQDMAGEYRQAMQAETFKPIEWRSLLFPGAKPVKVVLLGRLGDDYVIMPIIGENPLHGVVFLIEATQIKS